jgi:hypothetical protein
MEDVMPMLFWLPMIILSGIWSIAAEEEAERTARSRRDDDAALLLRSQ